MAAKTFVITVNRNRLRRPDDPREAECFEALLEMAGDLGTDTFRCDAADIAAVIERRRERGHSNENALH